MTTRSTAFLSKITTFDFLLKIVFSFTLTFSYVFFGGLQGQSFTDFIFAILIGLFIGRIFYKPGAVDI